MKFFLFTLGLCLLFVAPAAAQKDKVAATTYNAIEVEKFTIKNGVEFTPAQADEVTASIIVALQKTKKFDSVTRAEDANASTTTGKKLKLVGEITDYDKGNRAARYLIGFGAGASKIKATIKFVDVETGKTVLERPVDGVVWVGFFGGSSDGAKSGVAKEIAGLAKKNFTK